MDGVWGVRIRVPMGFAFTHGQGVGDLMHRKNCLRFAETNEIYPCTIGPPSLLLLIIHMAILAVCTGLPSPANNQSTVDPPSRSIDRSNPSINQSINPTKPIKNPPPAIDLCDNYPIEPPHRDGPSQFPIPNSQFPIPNKTCPKKATRAAPHTHLLIPVTHVTS